MNGTPELSSRDRYVSWAEILSEEFHALRQSVENDEKTDIDAYGAINPAEFFAVVTEEFFERPTRLEERHPELYGQLAEYYRLDPRKLWES